MLMSTRDAAAYLGLSVPTLNKLRSGGASPTGIPEVPFLRLGARTIRYRKDALDAWLAERDVTPNEVA